MCFALWTSLLQVRYPAVGLLVWKNPSLAPVIKFSRTGRTSEMHKIAVKKEKKEQGYEMNRAHLLRYLVNALVTRNVLNLRRHAHSTRLFAYLHVDLTFKKIVVKDKPTSSAESPRQEYSIQKQGGVVQSFRRFPYIVPGLSTMPPEVATSIYNLASFAPFGVTYDLDRRTAFGLDQSVLSNRQ
jgi:hypothetical protein